MMKSMIKCFLVLFIAFSLGCQMSGKTYNFIESSKYDGYVINRKGVIIPEYTIGKDKTAPEDLKLAQERFRRRKAVVEDYYKKMGVIFNGSFQMVKTMSGFAVAPFLLPFKVVDYKRYREDPEYRKQVDDAEENALQLEQERIVELKKELAVWVEEDLEKEESQ